MPDDKGKWLPEEGDRLKTAINGFDRMLCPSCKKEDARWSFGAYAAGLAVPKDFGRHFPLAVIFCTNCGHARMYYADSLLALGEEDES